MGEKDTVSAARDAARVRAAKRRRRLFLNLAIVAVVLIAVLGFLATRRRQPATPEGLVTGEVTRTDLVQQVSATGSVTAQTGAQVKIGSQITGRIKRLHADVGSTVRAGQVIAELDLPDLAAQVRQARATLALNQRRLSEQLAGVGLQSTQTRTAIAEARAGVATAQASVRQAQANVTNSSANLSRTQQLFEKGYVARADVDNARAQAQVNQAQLASARAQLSQAQAALQTALAGTAQNEIKQQQVAAARQAVAQSQAALALSEAQYDKTYIRSPISGTVTQLAQQEGETIAAGLSAPTLIIVTDLNRLQVDVYVDETDIGQVRLGQPATITVDAYPTRPFQGRVVKIASGSTMQQNVVTYDVTIALDNPEHLLKPDMTATANIIVTRLNNVLTVPVDAVKPGPQGGSTVTVMTKGRGGQSHFRVVPVSTGASDGERTVVLRGDLQEGDTVVLAGQVPGMESQGGGPRFRGPLGFGGGGRGRGGRGGGRGGG